MKHVNFLVLGLALLSGCASNVVQMGKGSYMATAHSCGMCESPIQKAILSANGYCGSKGLVATVTHTQMTGYMPPSAMVQFVCTDEAHQSVVVLRPDNGISTVENR
jgi:hypothetical protein